MIVMYDTVTIATVPPHPQAVAGYTSGYWPTYEGLVRAFPLAHHLSINVTAQYNADCLDIENGDAVPAQAPEWTRRQHARGIERPALYGSVSSMGAILGALTSNGIKRSEVRLWSAHYTYTPHICGTGCGMPNTDADATQWTDKALGRNLDESLCQDEFFGPVPPPRPHRSLLEPAERHEVQRYDELNRNPTAHPVAVKKVQQRLVELRKAVWYAAEGEVKHGKPKAQAWSFRHRAARYALLWSRTKGLR